MLIYFKLENIYGKIIVLTLQVENMDNWKIGINFHLLLSEGKSESAFFKNMICCMQNNYMNISRIVLWIFQ